jgi:hypothetical protein
MAGYSKIKQCCAQAALDGYKYAWIDSCCIDKTSSAEFSEAINSMFEWYRDAQVCYAYLADVPSGEDPRLENSAFRRSKWFTRGWTLQELLAPSMVKFFNQDWVAIGMKSMSDGEPMVNKESTLSTVISLITGIKDLSHFEEACIAQKMSWASKRETTRVEDMAYSLMGLFGVNMPPLYGEGQKAFIRLQLEILRVSDDESIFAWADDNDRYSTGLLALSPAAFKNSGDVVRHRFYNRPPYSVTNQGLSIEMRLETADPRQGNDGPGIFLSPFNCMRTGQQENRNPLAIFVEGRYCTDYSAAPNQYVRRFSDTLATTEFSKRNCLCDTKTGRNSTFHGVLYFRQPDIQQVANYFMEYKFSIDVGILLGLGFSISGKYLVSLEPGVSSTKGSEVRSTPNTLGEIRVTIGGNNVMGALMLTKEGVEGVVVLLYACNYRVRVDLLSQRENQPLREIIDSYCPKRSVNDVLCGFDPISRILDSGKSVCLFLDYEEECESIRSGGRLYKVEVIDKQSNRWKNWNKSLTFWF